MTIPGNANPLLLVSAAPTGYAIERSLRFNSADSAYLSRTPASAGNRTTFTWAGWLKRGTLSGTTTYQQIFSAGTGIMARDGFFIDTDVDDTLAFYSSSGLAGTALMFRTNAVLRDPSAWYHIVLAIDTTQATAANRVKLYVNGVEQSFATTSYPSQNATGYINSTATHNIGAHLNSGEYLSGYLADIHFIDGQALDPTSFGEFDDNGIWQPIDYTGSYGTNGFHLPFDDNSTAAALGTDTSGLGNNWNVFNISTTTGGPTSVAAASGALPIYNTTDTYGATKGTGTRTDSNSSSIVLAIPMDGANNGTTFTDESATIKGSGSAKSITRFGDTKTSTAQSKFYGSSGYFDGTGDYLTVAVGTDTQFGTGDFTVEWYLYYTGATSGFGGHILDFRGSNNGAHVYYVNDGKIFWTNNNVYGDIDTGVSVSANQWTHWVFARNSGTYRLFKDGVLVYSVANSDNIPSNPTLYIANRFNNSGQLPGYLQDLRIYKGVAKYTGNFNPPRSTANATIAAGNDSLVDVPTNGTETDTGVGGEVRGNYATLNPIWFLYSSAPTLSNGNLDYTSPGGVGTTATIGMSSGKWYCEATITASDNMVGIYKGQNKPSTNNFLGADPNGYGYYSNNGNKYNNNSSSAYGSSYTSGDIIGIAFDADAGTLVFYKNGVSQGTAFTGLTSGPYFFAFGSGTSTGSFNFGQRPFAYTAPSGFKALCTANLPSTTITTSGSYTGNGVADGPFVFLNGVPTAMTVNGNAVTFGTHADKLSNGFKIRTTSTTYNQNASTYNYTITSTGAPFKTARAQPNP